MFYPFGDFVKFMAKKSDATVDRPYLPDIVLIVSAFKGTFVK
jgi:hypothetical protein